MKQQKREVTGITRRLFAHRLMDVLLYGGFVHFTISEMALADYQPPESFGPACPGGGHELDLCLPASELMPETDVCPGGASTEDICIPEQGYEDACPGGCTPEDECPPSGLRPEDVCETGHPEADICTPGVEENGRPSDQCPSGLSSDDVCPEGKVDNSITDRCYSGAESQDACAEDGGVTDGDNCPGGGSAVDTCKDDGTGDECSPDPKYPDGSDKCNEKHMDECGFGAGSDVCNSGKNSLTGLGDSDACEHISIGSYSAGYGSDTCIDGSASQDECTGSLSDPDGKRELDVCLPAADGETKTEDICHPAEPIKSDDVCYQGLPSSDQCEPDVGDEDECPGGIADVDACQTGFAPEDECPGGSSECDECYPDSSGSDECTLAERSDGIDSPPPDCPSLDMDHVE